MPHIPARLTILARPRPTGFLREKRDVSSIAPQAEKEASMAPHMGSVPPMMAGSTGATLSSAARYHALAFTAASPITSASRAHSRYRVAGYFSSRSNSEGGRPKSQPSASFSHSRQQVSPPAPSRADAAQRPCRQVSSAAEATEAAAQQAITAPRSIRGSPGRI